MEASVLEKQLKIVYYYNSGFSVQVGSTLFIFDYWEGENRSLSASVRIRPELLKAYERIYVFISHAHPDHLDPVVYTWAKEGLPITYIVSSDMPIGTIGSVTPKTRSTSRIVSTCPNSAIQRSWISSCMF